jgi:hypothetical protein
MFRVQISKQYNNYAEASIAAMELGGKDFLTDSFRGFDHEQAEISAEKACENKSPKCLITKENIQISDELIIDNDHINASIEAWFDVDERFGTATYGADDYINLYADFYPDTDKLSVYYTIYHADGGVSDSITVTLEPSERNAILNKMEIAGLDIVTDIMFREQRAGMKFE